GDLARAEDLRQQGMVVMGQGTGEAAERRHRGRTVGGRLRLGLCRHLCRLSYAPSLPMTCEDSPAKVSYTLAIAGRGSTMGTMTIKDVDPGWLRALASEDGTAPMPGQSIRPVYGEHLLA